MADDRDVIVEQALDQTIGASGRMISQSKNNYREQHPRNLVVFNANVCLSPGGKIWHGDLDLTVEESQVVDLARRTGAIVYVLDERAGRFENEQSPLIAEAVYSVTPSGHTMFPAAYVERGADGALRCRTAG
jgi:hypothetical protein